MWFYGLGKISTEVSIRMHINWIFEDCFLLIYKDVNQIMAEKQGFEPWEGINPQRFSRPPLSATQPPLHTRGEIIQEFFLFS